MRSIRFALAVSVGFAYPTVARAHEKWFIDAGPYPTSWSSALRVP
jgi:hypothetical protein